MDELPDASASKKTSVNFLAFNCWCNLLLPTARPVCICKINTCRQDVVKEVSVKPSPAKTTLEESEGSFLDDSVGGGEFVESFIEEEAEEPEQKPEVADADTEAKPDKPDAQSDPDVSAPRCT